MSRDAYPFIAEFPAHRTRSSYLRYPANARIQSEESFRCKYCQAYVHTIPELSGVQNRNHCPYCLHSRHLDLERPGDRLSACKGMMAPVGLTVKPGRNKYASIQSGELMLIHRCSECGTISLNRIASDDTPIGLFIVLQDTEDLDQMTLQHMEILDVRLLKVSDKEIVTRQLYGKY